MSTIELFEAEDPRATVEDGTPLALVQVIKAEHVEEGTAVAIQAAFAPFFAEADEWRMKAQSIKVTDASQKADMAMARVIRLKLKDIRVAADKKRKDLKEDSLRYGRAVQGAYNILEFLVAPLEKQLEESEKFAEVQEAKRRAELKASREIQLTPWKEFVPFGLDLGAMDEENFNKVLSGAKLQHQAKIDADARAEAERQERLKAEEAERQRIREENERLRLENEAKERQLAEERRAREQAEEEARRRQEEIDRQKAAEQEERDRQAREAAEAEERKRSASDKVKVQTFAAQIRDLEFPAVTSSRAKAIINDARGALAEIAAEVDGLAGVL